METRQLIFDLIIVGYGPTGLALASLLGQKGHSIAVVERWPALYGLPRLTHIDGETARLISLAATDGDHALRESWATPHYNWQNGKGQLLFDVAASNQRRMLWDDHISVHQPHIEEAIHERIATLANVQLYRGYTASGLQQSDAGVELTITPSQNDPQALPLQLRGSYLVAADGSKSFVREALGVERIDFGFNERWLCVDTEPLRELPPKFKDNATQVCDPKRGYMFMPIGRKRQRFEFCVLDKEDTTEMAGPAAAWRLLEQYHGLGPADLKIIRQVVYTFECRLASRWRVGRVFLAGDAAHTNPPYLGQGACSGMRDAANLAWKFDLVLRGVAHDTLLDTYEQERRPHAQSLMLGSRSLGQIANTANPVKAALRDLLFRLRLNPSAPAFPVLTAGALQHKASGSLAPGAGSLPAQGRLVVNGQTLRFDQHAGFGFTLLLRHAPSSAAAARMTARLGPLGARVYVLAPTQEPGLIQVQDVNGVYLALLDELAADVAILRPDFVLFGHSELNGMDTLLEELARQLNMPPASPPDRACT
ncbi:MAG: bifunctional 3-(3-hydroxy-phenyl)propionate/3-hydroxycinnamic acid hydroxylase [Pseudomonadota bacterium]